MSRLDLTVDEVIMAAQKIGPGGGPFEGESLRDALFELNLVIQDIVNHDIPLSFIKEFVITVTAGTRTVELDPEITDVFSAVDVTDPSSPTPLTRQGMIEFQKRNNAVTQGDVSTFSVHAKKTGATMLLWPIPSVDTTLKMYCQTAPEPIESYDDKLQIKSEFLGTVIDGLAYRLTRRNPKETTEFEQKLSRLLTTYNKGLGISHHADRERSSFRVRFSR